MKLKFSLLSILCIALFSFSGAAQKTISDISDSAFEDTRLLIAGQFAERTVIGKVVGVHDGDTATVLDKDKVQYKIRFNGIDAPELKMDFGNKAKQNLSDLIFGKTVTVKFSKVDKYGRYVGNIYIDGKDANLEQVKAGLAWHYKKYQDEQKEVDRQSYAEAETKAREAKIGFWSMPDLPTPPWDYRTELKAIQADERANRMYTRGAKGGCYYTSSSGKKSYVDKKYCAQPKGKLVIPLYQPTILIKPVKVNRSTDKNSETKKTDSSGRTYIKGSSGGCYYMNGDKKVYVKDKSLCSN